jgi:hypothetical protein
VAYLGVKGSQVQILSSRRSDGRCHLLDDAAHLRVYLLKHRKLWIFGSRFIDLACWSTLVVERQTGAKLERAAFGHEMGSMIRSRFRGLFGWILAGWCQLIAVPGCFAGAVSATV